MSKLALKNGDDHPEAAKKHLSHAEALSKAGYPDGAAYLAGYVVECSLKSVMLLQTNAPNPKWRGKDGHDLPKLHSDLINLATRPGSRIGRYLRTAVEKLPEAGILAWNPEMRYRAPSIGHTEAANWVDHARLVYSETVGKMILDGVI
jgi:HEPN domain-containing protein